MIYTCVKCKFLFERKNEPSKCPSCENQYVVGANRAEREAFKDLYGNQGNGVNLPTTRPNETQ